MQEKLPTTAEIDKMIRRIVEDSEKRFETIKRDVLDAVRTGHLKPENGVKVVNQAYLGHIEVLKAVRAIS